jgi:uncharacterized membrane protein
MAEPAAKMRKKYDLARHHAWAGLGLLSVVAAVRLLLPALPDGLFLAISSTLIVYILFWLFLTYRYRAGLKADSSPITEVSAEKAKTALEKARLKLEKKRAKAEIKARKKAG